MRLALLALLAVALHGADLKCGAVATQPQPGIASVHVACLDYTGLRKIAPSVPWPTKPQTQLLIRAENPGAVRVDIGGKTRWAELTQDADGRWYALIVVDGIEYTEYAIKVFRPL